MAAAAIGMRSMCSPTANDEDAYAQMKAPIRSLFFCPGPVSTEGAKGGKSAVSGARRHGASRKTRAPDLAGWAGAMWRGLPRAHRRGALGREGRLRRFAEHPDGFATVVGCLCCLPSGLRAETTSGNLCRAYRAHEAIRADGSCPPAGRRVVRGRDFHGEAAAIYRRVARRSEAGCTGWQCRHVSYA